MDPDFLIQTLASVVAAATPVVFASVGETISEKVGVINLSLDGSIALSAMAGFAGVMAGYYAGKHLYDRMNAKMIRACICALMGISGLILLFK